MAHPLARRSRLPGHEGHHGLGHLAGDERRRPLLVGAADLADEHHLLRPRIPLEEAQNIHKGGADDGVAPDAHTGGLAQAPLGQRPDHLVGQGAAARDDAHRARPMDVARHDAHLGLARRDDARTVGAYEAATLLIQIGAHLDQVQGGDTLGDADDEPDAGVSRLEDGVGSEAGRHVDDRSVGARGFDRLLDRVEDGHVVHLAAPFARRDAGHHLGAVLNHPAGVERPLPPGDPLDEKPGIFIYKDAHDKHAS